MWLCAPAQVPMQAYLIDYYPGNEIFELEGHTLLAVAPADTSASEAATLMNRGIGVSYGVFNFNDPGFVWRFVAGQTDYMCMAAPLAAFNLEYAHSRRRAVAHRLNLSPEQTSALAEFLENNVRPENRVYRYNYVLDNCATRPLAAIETVAGDSITFEGAADTGATFRSMMRRYHRNYPWYQFGIDLALGGLIDRPVDVRGMTFAPVALDSLLPRATIGGKPLVGKSFVLLDNPPYGPVAPPTPWYLTPMAAGWALFAVGLGICVRDWRRRHITRWFTSAVFAVFAMAGCLIAFLVLVSEHYATSPNWLLVWLNPICALPAVCIWIKRARKAVFCYQICNFAVLTALAVAWEWLPQQGNPAFVPFYATDMILSATYIALHIQSQK